MARIQNSLLFLAALCVLTAGAIFDARAQTDFVPPALPQIPEHNFNVIQFGAKGDGVFTNSSAIQSAIDAANKIGGGVVEIPAGVFVCGPLKFASGINLRLDAGATLRMLPLVKYPGGTEAPPNFISGSHLHDIAITGKGAIDGQGSPWWPFARTRGARRPRMIEFSGCNRVLIDGITLSNSPMFHIAISGGSSNITVHGVTIRANPSTDPVNPSHNTDACDVSGRHVLIQDCDVSVGDDNFTCGGNTSDVLITNCTYGYGHGVSIGSPIVGGVSNLTVINCTFHDTEQGIRIKSDRDRGGLVQNLRYLNLTMTNVGVPILIYASYQASKREYRALNNVNASIAAKYPPASVTDRTPIYQNITFSNIVATAQPGHRAGLIWGLPEMPVRDVIMEDIHIKADKPLGIYFADGVRIVDSKIETSEGVNKISITNSKVKILN